jgi:hypothetical protein
MNGDKLPFGVPPTVLMQTGNQQTVNNLEQSVEFPPIDSQSDPSFDHSQQVSFEQQTFTPPVFGGNTQISTEKQKYKIVDIFWLLNSKFYDQKPLVKGEAHFVVISFNITFNNMRISFFNLTDGSIQGNVAFLNKMQRTVSGTIYPASAFHVVNASRISKVCLEQLWQATGEAWQQNRPICKVEKNENLVRLTIQDNQNGAYFYDFAGWQREAFLYACQFAYTQGMMLTAQNVLSS